MGQPPAMKRPRGTGRAAIGVAAGRDPAFEGRNATGRNYSNGVEVNGKVSSARLFEMKQNERRRRES